MIVASGAVAAVDRPGRGWCRWHSRRSRRVCRWVLSRRVRRRGAWRFRCRVLGRRVRRRGSRCESRGRSGGQGCGSQSVGGLGVVCDVLAATSPRVPLTADKSGFTTVTGETDAGVVVVAHRPGVIPVDSVSIAAEDVEIGAEGVGGAKPVLLQLVVHVERAGVGEAAVVHLLVV